MLFVLSAQKAVADPRNGQMKKLSMQVCHIHSLQHTLPYEWLSVLLCHEEYSVFLKVNGAIAGHHLTIILQCPDLDLRVFGWNQILQSQ